MRFAIIARKVGALNTVCDVLVSVKNASAVMIKQLPKLISINCRHQQQ